MSASVAAVLFAAAITPGPNNLIVMDAAARGRLSSALPPIAGIVLGTIGIVLVVRFGLDTVMARWPGASDPLRYLGAGLLLYLAIRMVLAGWRAAGPDQAKPPSSGGTFLSLVALQIANPKTWVLATTVSTTHAAQGDGSLAVLIALTAAVPALCLSAWALAGRSLVPLLQRSVPRCVFAVTMGSILAGFAAALIASDL